MTTSKKALLELANADTYYYLSPWLSTNVESAAKGLGRLGYDIQGFDGGDLHNAPLRRSTIVKGSIRTVRMALHHLGLPQPENLDIPESLNKYTHRNIWKTTLGAIRKANRRVFIKPADIQKGFKGHVFSDRHDWFTRDFKDNYAVLASEVVCFESEWRVYVLKKQIIGVRCYDGVYRRNPPPPKALLENMVRDFKDAPAAYALDVGKMKMSNGGARMALVEVNEGFSLGNYGIPHIQYAKMVEARWKEMVRD